MRGTKLYLIGLADGRLKVGRSRNVKQRLSTHKSMHQHVWAHVFTQRDSGSSERKCIKQLERIGERIGRTEMFVGISRESAVEVCRQVVEENAKDVLEWERRNAEREQDEQHAQNQLRIYAAVPVAKDCQGCAFHGIDCDTPRYRLSLMHGQDCLDAHVVYVNERKPVLASAVQALVEAA